MSGLDLSIVLFYKEIELDGYQQQARTEDKIFLLERSVYETVRGQVNPGSGQLQYMKVHR